MFKTSDLFEIVSIDSEKEKAELIRLGLCLNCSGKGDIPFEECMSYKECDKCKGSGKSNESK